jgi:hypothetical protein
MVVLGSGTNASVAVCSDEFASDKPPPLKVDVRREHVASLFTSVALSHLQAAWFQAPEVEKRVPVTLSNGPSDCRPRIR